MNKFVFIAVVLLVSVFPNTVYAGEIIPPLPHIFYGGVDSANGSEIRCDAIGVVYTDDNPVYSYSGKYGESGLFKQQLLVQGNIVDEYPLEFYISDMRAEVSTDGIIWNLTYPYNSGETTRLDMRVYVQNITPTTSITTTPTTSPTPTYYSSGGGGGSGHYTYFTTTEPTTETTTVATTMIPNQTIIEPTKNVSATTIQTTVATKPTTMIRTTQTTSQPTTIQTIVEFPTNSYSNVSSLVESEDFDVLSIVISIFVIACFMLVVIYIKNSKNDEDN